jgi:hypothetical protein
MIGTGSTVQDYEPRTLAQTLKVDLGVCCLYVSVANQDLTPEAPICRTTQFQNPLGIPA